jgi:transposase
MMTPLRFLLVLSFYVASIECPNRNPILTQLAASVTEDEQRAFVKIQTLLDISPPEIHRQLRTAIGDNVFSERWVRQLVVQFRDGTRVQSSIEPSGGRPKTATSEAMQEALQNLMEEFDGPRTLELAHRLNIGQESVREMLHELGYKYVKSRWVPHELSADHKKQRVDTCKKNLKLLKDEDDLLGRIIAIDEFWLPSYMPLTDTQARSWQLKGSTP